MNVIEEIIGLISEKLQVLKTIGTIIKLEMRLAGLSVLPLLLNICLLFVVVLGLWLSSLVLIGNLFWLAVHNSLIAISIVIGLNILFLLGLLKYLSFNLKKMSFEKTRKYLLQSENYNDQKTKINSGAQGDGKRIKNSPNESPNI